MLEPTLSGKILGAKLEHIAETGAEQVLTANPGCMIQIQQGLASAGIPAGVSHVVDLLDEAYRAEEGS